MTGRAPIRMCAGCRQRHPVTGLLRVEGRVVADVYVAAVAGLGKREGRGAYVCPTQSCVIRGMHRICRSSKVTPTQGQRLLSGAVDSAQALLNRRKTGLRRRGIRCDDTATSALATIVARLDMAVETTAVGA